MSLDASTTGNVVEECMSIPNKPQGGATHLLEIASQHVLGTWVGAWGVPLARSRFPISSSMKFSVYFRASGQLDLLSMRRSAGIPPACKKMSSVGP
jgi:hypothetical protein